MKPIILTLVFISSITVSLAQVVEISREQKIAKFNATALQKAALYQNYTPKPATYEVSDDFKVNHKYLYTWIQDDVLRITSDAQIGLCYVSIRDATTGKELCSIDHNYQAAPVFSDKVLLSELRAKMPGGTKGYYQVYYATSDRYSGRITYDPTQIVLSPNAAPVEKGAQLVSISVSFATQDHDKEAGKWVAFQVTKKQRTSPDFYKYVVGGMHIEDPAKWDYGNIQKFNVDTKPKKAYMSDFANGGNIQVTNMPTDLWDVTIVMRFDFSDGTHKSFRARKTSNPANGSVWSVDFDKDFKVVKEYKDF